MPESFTARN